jgi:hypothetical protein
LSDWKHINDEKPQEDERGEAVLVWNPFTEYTEIFTYNKQEQCWDARFGPKTADIKDFPHWQPLPTKGPEDENH